MEAEIATIRKNFAREEHELEILITQDEAREKTLGAGDRAIASQRQGGR